MNKQLSGRAPAFLAISVALVLGMAAATAVAQQKQKVVYSVAPENTKYVQQHSIEVGDVPGHQIRIYEIQRTFPKDAPVINGVRLVETWSRGYSNYIDMDGPSSVYVVYVMESGDKFFGRVDLISQGGARNPDGSRRGTATVTGVITGGTGKFVGIRGLTRSAVSADIKAGFNATQTELEYWMEK